MCILFLDFNNHSINSQTKHMQLFLTENYNKNIDFGTKTENNLQAERILHRQP